MTEQQNTMQKALAILQKNQNEWLKNNQPEEVLYKHIIHTSRVEQILDYTAKIQGKVLDIGCFDGYITEQIVKQGDKEVIGMDRWEEAMQITRSRGIKTVWGDMDDPNMPFADNYFDCVVAADVLNSVFDPDAVMEEITRVLKPKGKLIITVPNLASSGNRLLMLLGFAPYNLQVRARTGAGHLRLFTFRTLKKLLLDYHFAIEKMSSTVVIFPFFRLRPRVPEYQQPRIFFSKFLARLFPTLGESIVVIAENGK
jgi:ubiquinone/menaquinone biosynthesis C-methylase UbiE